MLSASTVSAYTASGGLLPDERADSMERQCCPALERASGEDDISNPGKTTLERELAVGSAQSLSNTPEGVYYTDQVVAELNVF